MPLVEMFKTQLTGTGASVVAYFAALDSPHALTEWVTTLIVTCEWLPRQGFLRTSMRWSRWGVCAGTRHPCTRGRLGDIHRYRSRLVES